MNYTYIYSAAKNVVRRCWNFNLFHLIDHPSSRVPNTHNFKVLKEKMCTSHLSSLTRIGVLQYAAIRGKGEVSDLDSMLLRCQ